MQTIGIKPPSSDTMGVPPLERNRERGRLRRTRGRDLLPLLAGAAVAVGGVGAALALSDADSPLRGPFTLFFLLAAPAAALGAALRGLEPAGRLLASVAGAVVVDMLVAQAMLTVHQWSVRGGIVAVTALSFLILLPVRVRRLRGRTARRRAS